MADVVEEAWSKQLPIEAQVSQSALVMLVELLIEALVQFI